MKIFSFGSRHWLRTSFGTEDGWTEFSSRALFRAGTELHINAALWLFENRILNVEKMQNIFFSHMNKTKA